MLRRRAQKKSQHAGIVKPTMATTNADTRPISAAICALIWKKASAANITTTGIAAAMVDSQTLLNGSYTWDHMGDLLRLYQRFKS